MDTQEPAVQIPLGFLEPHVGLLSALPDDQLLYKVMKAEHLVRSVAEGYLHFNRVDSYADGPWADPLDGAQLPSDAPGNDAARFERAPESSAADYYALARERTYACCFSLENLDHIWQNYANGSIHGKVAIVAHFGRLREQLRAGYGNTALDLGDGLRGRQILSLNFGLVHYVEWDQHRKNAERLPNPITYAHVKAQRFQAEQELRVSLSALGIGQFQFRGQRIGFPPSLQWPFDFREALARGTILEIKHAPDCDTAFLFGELEKLSIFPAPNNTP